MEEDKRLKEYQEGYSAGKKSLTDEKGIEQFVEGYKSGYKDGYQAAMEEMKQMMDEMPTEVKQKMREEGIQLAWWPRIW
jgi:hypothetical protein